MLRSPWALVACSVFVLLLAAVNLSKSSPVAADQRGTVYVYIKDHHGYRLPGACFELYELVRGGHRGDRAASRCDRLDSGPNDGKIVFRDMPAGFYVLAEFRPPPSFEIAPDRQVIVVSREYTKVSVVNSEGGTAVMIAQRSPTGRSLTGACFVAYRLADDGTAGDSVTGECDGNDPLDGVTTLRGVPAGSFLLVQSRAVDGYLAAMPLRIEVLPKSRTIDVGLSVKPLVAAGSVEIAVIDGRRRPVTGVCFRIYQLEPIQGGSNAADSSAVGPPAGFAGCDGKDGRSDGRLTLSGLAIGAYVAIQDPASGDGVLTPERRFVIGEESGATLRLVANSATPILADLRDRRR